MNTMINSIKYYLLVSFVISNFSFNASSAPKGEYPRPQFQREGWFNLNGVWTYEIDNTKSGKEKGYTSSKGFNSDIIVPFCPESKLSGVKHTDFIHAMWYHQKLSIPDSWQEKLILLHFGGVDYKAEIYIDGNHVFSHYGGSASFSVDITTYVTTGNIHNLVVYVEDDVRSQLQTTGKQSHRLFPYSCLYPRVTGIWQTVWVEAVNSAGLKKVKISPDLDGSQFVFEPQYYNIDNDNILEIIIKASNKTVFRKHFVCSNVSKHIAVIKNVQTWSPENPFLYDILFNVKDKNGNVVDQVSSYAGMRKVEIIGKKFYLNNKEFYQRLVLDQGYYPDGLWTSPSDEALKMDVELGKAAGFNGARLHQKVFEPRFLYWADKLGYLTWGESASWGMDWSNEIAARNMITEWESVLERDYNSPSLVIWSPLNETWADDVNGQRTRLTNDLYAITKRLDPTRPIVTVSGGFHTGYTDIFAEHTYEQDPKLLFNLLKDGEHGTPYIQFRDKSGPYKGEPYMIDEFGGIQWIHDNEISDNATNEFWGYGSPPRSLVEFYDRLEKHVNVILSLDHIVGFCYTQLYDVELEKNGIFTYDRNGKFDLDRINKIFSKCRIKAKTEVEEMLKNN